MITISNSKISAEIAEHGAEPCSMVKDGRELLWQADKTFWGRHAPILFPIVGRVFGNEYRIGETVFNLSQHGFARDSDFEVVSAGDSECVLRLVSTAETKAKFPFDFELVARYMIDDDKLVCRWEVVNTGKVVMPCQIGGHPAFNFVDYPEGEKRGSFLFLKDGKPLESFVATRINKEGCALPDKQIVKLSDGKMALTTLTFDDGVYILEGSQCDEVRMVDNTGKEYLTLSSDSPVFGIWSPEKRNAPFVCIEPWKGRTDPDGYTGQFSEKPWINLIDPGDSLKFEYSIK